MIRADQIPPDAMYAAWKAMNAGMTLNDAIAAALNAWPGVTTTSWFENGVRKAVMNIPLPQDVSDE